MPKTLFFSYGILTYLKIILRLHGADGICNDAFFYSEGPEIRRGYVVILRCLGVLELSVVDWCIVIGPAFAIAGVFWPPRFLARFCEVGD
jgi:hypothetical protein